MTDPRPQRHTGTVRRGALRQPQHGAPPRSLDVRAGWVALVLALIVAAGALSWLLGIGEAGGVEGAGSPTAGATLVAIGGSASPSATEQGGRTAAPTPSESPTGSAEPTPTSVPTPQPTARPTVTSTTVPPTSVPTAMPTLTPAPTTDPTSEPTPQAGGLLIDFPVDGEVVRSQRINVIGTAPPGSTVTRDIPLWFDDHTTAGDDGLWMMPVDLAEGENRLTFRLGDDHSTVQVIVVTYRPAR